MYWVLGQKDKARVEGRAPAAGRALSTGLAFTPGKPDFSFRKTSPSNVDKEGTPVTIGYWVQNLKATGQWLGPEWRQWGGGLASAGAEHALKVFKTQG